MDENLCFKIGEVCLYLEQVLVSYNDVPIFFICNDNVSHYAVLCTDINELNYVIVELSDKDLCNLLSGILPMRDVFTKQEYYWEILSGNEAEYDTVIRKPVRELNYSILPKAGACYDSIGKIG